MEIGRSISKKIDRVIGIARYLLLVQLLLLSNLLTAKEVAVPYWKYNPIESIKVGDIVFRKGAGLWTRYFINASSREKRFSHVGIVVSNMPTTIILHADANDLTGVGKVRLEKWNDFFSNASECAVYRYDGDFSNALMFADVGMSKLGIPFDWSFNMNSADSLYCTELVRNVINDVLQTNLIGHTEVCGRRIIAVDDIYRSRMRKIFDSSK